MRVPLSWLQDFVDISLSAAELADRLTLAGLEVGKIDYLGTPESDLPWDRDRLVLGHLLKVEPHPNADRLVLATVDIGRDEPETVVTGAPNLFPYLNEGDISELGLMSPFVMEGATVYDGYAKEPGQKMTLKGREIRGIMNRHMLCSEKELGLSDDHEGIILARDAAAPGTPLVDLWADAVLDIDLTPNIIRCSSMLGVAREVAALTGQPLRYPDLTYPTDSEPLAPKLAIETTHPDLNPRFVAILIEGIEVGPSPYWMQRRLRLAGMRPINNVVDISNYVMLEVGQPNHAFDWDILRRRADDYAGPDGPVNIITRLAQPGETVLTLDDKTHEMPGHAILVTDPQSNLSIGGIMGGAESEVSPASNNILLEAAAWNFINIRRTSQALNLKSEAAYRFSRGIHPAQAMLGALRGARLLSEIANGTITHAPLDYYPNPPDPVRVDLPLSEVPRLLGVDIDAAEVRRILESLEFEVDSTAEATFTVTVPDHRMDISAEPTTGRADLVEEIARIYGYDNIPVTEIADDLPPQRDNVSLDLEERTRDLLVQIGLQEVITYRLTTPEAEARILGQDYAGSYITLANPSTPERVAMRHSLLNSVLEVVAANLRFRDRIELFEIGHLYLPHEHGEGEAALLPAEPRRLAIALTGPRQAISWQATDRDLMDFYDLKGRLEALARGLHLGNLRFNPVKHPAYHPGRVAELLVENTVIGLMGQLHPLVVEAYDMPLDAEQPLLAADLDLDALLANVSVGYEVSSVSRFPAVQQDIAIVVSEAIPAANVHAAIMQAGQPLVVEARLFDVYRGEQIGAGNKSLAYSLTYQAEDRTLTDKVVAKQQTKIIKHLEKTFKAQLRS